MTLADLLALLRAADATPSSLAKMSPDPSFLPRRLWGADRWRAAVVAGVRQGEGKVALRRRIGIGEATLQRTLDLCLSDESLTPDEVTAYRYHPRSDDETLRQAEILACDGLSVSAVSDRLGVPRPTVDWVRCAITSLVAPTTNTWFGQRGRNDANWNDYRERRRAEISDGLEALERRGKPITMRHLRTRLGSNVGMSLGRAAGRSAARVATISRERCSDASSTAGYAPTLHPTN